MKEKMQIYYHPYRTYTAREAAQLCNFEYNYFLRLVRAGLITVMKTGKSLIFTNNSIQEFLNRYDGHDLSNFDKAIEAKVRVEMLEKEKVTVASSD